jgi:hypothetical protein
MEETMGIITERSIVENAIKNCQDVADSRLSGVDRK